MTMADLFLESIQGLGIRFDRHAARLKALEERFNARWTQAIAPTMRTSGSEESWSLKLADDDDPDKDRGRSTRTPGVHRQLGRGTNRRRAAIGKGVNWPAAGGMGTSKGRIRQPGGPAGTADRRA